MAQPKLLLVEDDLEIRDILQDLLEAEGYEVIPAGHGRQALDYLEGAAVGGLPDLVVLDLMLPLVHGAEVLAAMKRDPKLSPIPVVVLSAVTHEGPAGAAAFLPKPIPLQKLFDTIRTFVRGDVGVPTPA
jgi:CheY-like chemotaxis protein